MTIEINSKTPITKTELGYALVIPCVGSVITVRGEVVRRGIRNSLRMTATVDTGMTQSRYYLGCGRYAWSHLQGLASKYDVCLWGTWQGLGAAIRNCVKRNKDTGILSILDNSCPV